MVSSGRTAERLAGDLSFFAPGAEIIVMPEEDVIDAFLLELKRSREAGKSTADDNDIIVVFVKFHFFFLSCNKPPKTEKIQQKITFFAYYGGHPLQIIIWLE